MRPSPNRSVNRSGTPKRAVSGTHSMAAPTGGLNAVNALANMPETDCIVMDNWFPQPSYVELRNGYSNWSTGLPGWVESLMGYTNATGEHLFAASGTAFYNVTASGAVGAAVVTGLTNARWEYTNMATSGGQFLIAANAVDAPQLYDGTNWSNPTITGVTNTLLRNPIVWKNRIWFVENNSMRAWYLPTSSIQGAASQFDLGPQFRLGGYLHTILTCNFTDGSTFDNYICFMSSEGEIAMYRGTDPAQAGVFGLYGIYRVGKPIGRRCFFKSGDDTIIICSDGFVSLTQLISVGRLSQEKTVSYKILNLVNTDVQLYNSNFGWQGVVHPLGNKIIINVPQSENSVQYQYVMNAITNAWCRFTGWNAACFEVVGNSLYFGGNGIVALADTGQADGSAAIVGSLKTAFSYLGSDRQKLMKAVRPLISVTGQVAIGLAMNADFADAAPLTIPTTTALVGSPWDTSTWDTSHWSGDFTMQKAWQTVSGFGFAQSLYLRVSSTAVQMRLQAIDYLFESGGVL